MKLRIVPIWNPIAKPWNSARLNWDTIDANNADDNADVDNDADGWDDG